MKIIQNYSKKICDYCGEKIKKRDYCLLHKGKRFHLICVSDFCNPYFVLKTKEKALNILREFGFLEKVKNWGN